VTPGTLNLGMAKLFPVSSRNVEIPLSGGLLYIELAFLDLNFGVRSLQEKLGSIHTTEERRAGSSGLCVHSSKVLSHRIFSESIRLKLTKHFVPEGHCRRREKCRITF